MAVKVKLKCPQCGHEGQIDAEFLGKETQCARCGQIFVAQAIKGELVVPMESLDGTREMTCPSCGTFVPSRPGATGEIHCPVCGQLLQGRQSPVPMTDSGRTAAAPSVRLTMTCPYCKATSPVEAAWIGQEGECTECGKSFIIQADAPLAEKKMEVEANQAPASRRHRKYDDTNNWVALVWSILSILGLLCVWFCIFRTFINEGSYETCMIGFGVWFLSSALSSYVFNVRGESLVLAKFLSFLYIGLGHFYLGRIGKGLLYALFFSIATMVLQIWSKNLTAHSHYLAWANFGLWLAFLRKICKDIDENG